MGSGTEASGFAATAMGSGTSGNFTIAMGYNANTALGEKL